MARDGHTGRRAAVSIYSGRVVRPDGALVAAYRARVPLFCAGCGRRIAVGEYFTRPGAPASLGGGQAPHCDECNPFAGPPSW